MAEALPDNKDDQMTTTCNMCLEQYTDPYILTQCSHCFCLQCIKQLEIDGQIQCVECRLWTKMCDIRKNTEIARIIDQRKSRMTRDKESSAEDDIASSKSDTSDVVTPSTKQGPLLNTCTLCKAWKPIRCRCMDCSRFMCSDCITLHNREQENENHTVKSVNEVIHMSQSKIHNALNELIAEKKNLDLKTAELDKTVQDIQQAQQEQIAMVKRVTQESIERLKQTEKDMSEKIQSTNDALVRDMEKDQHIYEDTMENLKGRFHCGK